MGGEVEGRQSLDSLNKGTDGVSSKYQVQVKTECYDTSVKCIPLLNILH